MKTYKTNYSVAVNWCNNALILCNNITEIDPSIYVHFLAFTTEEEMRNDNLSQNKLYAIAKKRANDLGFSVYRANWYGGGFVGQSYSLIDTANKINEIVNK